jgi:zinc protease
LTPTRRDLSALLATLVATAAAGPALARQRRPADDSVGSTPDWPYVDFGPPGRVVEQSEVKALNLTFVRFANGVRLTIMPTTLARDHALVRVRTGHGELDLPKDHITAVGALGPRVVQGGLEQMTADEVTAALQGRRVSAGFAVQPGSFAQLGVTAPKDLKLRSGDFEDDVATDAALYERAKARPDSLLQQQLPALLRSGDARWRKADPETLAALKPKDNRDFMQPILARDAIEVVVVGDISPPPVIEAVASTYGALPDRVDRAHPAGAREIAFPAATPTPVVLRHHGPADKAIVYTAWPTSGYVDRKNSAARRLMRLLLRGRLDDLMIAGHFAAETVSGDLYERDTYPNYGYVALQAATSPDQVAKVLDAMTMAAAGLTGEIKGEELERVRKQRGHNVDRDALTNTYWMASVAGMQTNPLLIDDVTSGAANLQAVTAEDVRTAAQAYLSPAKAWRLIVLPEGVSLPGLA